jgi:hypothetical protein
MAQTTDMSALFKAVFGDGIVQAVPDFAKLLKTIPFDQRERTGDHFEIPVFLELEQGFTYQAYGDAAPALVASSGGVTQKAQVNGAIIILRSQMSYDQLYRATQKGPQAFKDAIGSLYDNMVRSMGRRLEIAFVLGGAGLGQVNANDGSGGLTITDESWAPGVFAGMVGATLNAYTALTGGTQHNGDVVITAVDMVNKKITVSGTSAAIATNDYLFFKTARGKEAVGIDAILSNNGSLFNIDASQHALWKAQTSAVNGPLNMAAVLTGVSLAVNGGLMEKAKLYVSPKRWNALNTDQAALRRYETGGGEADNGSEELCYYSSNGKIEVVPHSIVPEGRAYLLVDPEKRWMRVGSSDITFRRPGRPDDIFMEVPDSGSVELRLFADQQPFCPTPAQNCKYTSITN